MNGHAIIEPTIESDMETNRTSEDGASSISTGDHDIANRATVNDTATTYGGYNKQLDPPISEESPLLSNGSENGRNGASSGNAGENNTEWHGAKDFEGLSWWRRPSVFWLLPAFSIYALAFGGIIVPRINLVVELICRKYLEDRSAIDPTFIFVPVSLAEEDSPCRSTQVQELATAFILYSGLIGGIPTAITSPILGELSDRFGRKPLMIFITFGGLIGEIITVLVARYPDTVHYSWLLGAAFIDGLCGSFITGWAVTHSYTADCVHPSKRAIAFGYFYACFFTGIALGPIVAAFMFKLTKSRISIFYLALTCHSLFLAVTFIIPESLSKRRQIAAREKYALEKRARSASSIVSIIKSTNIFAPLKILYPTGEGSSPQVRTNILLLSTIGSIVFGIAISSTSVITLYSGYQFKWTDYETNLFLSVANSSRVTSLVILLPILTYIFRTRYKDKVESGTEMAKRNLGLDNFDSWMIRVSLLADIAGFSGYAFVRRGDLFFISGALASFGGIGSPILQSVLIKHVPHDRTGQLLGAIGLLHALVRVVCPPVFSSIYIATVESFPQTVFIAIAGCFTLALALSFFVRPHVFLVEPSIKPPIEYAPERENLDADGIFDEGATGI